MSARYAETTRGFVALLLCTGCTTILGIDGEYVIEDTDAGFADAGFSAVGGTGGDGGAGGLGAGGTGSGAAPSGGFSGSAGLGAGGGIEADGGGGVPMIPCPDGCPAGTKCCAGQCVEPSPLYGCSLDGCESCRDKPDNAVGICQGGECGFECVQGFVEEAGQCVPDGSSGGAGGAPPPMCDPMQCPPCITSIYAPCCQDNGACGCAFPFAPCFPK